MNVRIRTLSLVAVSAFACVDNAADVKADDNNIAPQALTTTPPSATRTPVATATSLAVFPGERTLLFSQAHFERVMHEGKEIPKPLPAKLLMLTPEGDGFRADILQDQESRVFHKAICVKTDVGVRLLTIGGTEAILKMWRVEEGAWKADTLWNPKFGGKWDRLRDFSMASLSIASVSSLPVSACRKVRKDWSSAWWALRACGDWTSLGIGT